MINNKIVTIDESEFFHFRNDAHKIIAQLDLNLEKSRITYKYTISGNNMLIKIESDFSNLVNNRSKQKKDQDYHFIKYLGYDFCFIHADNLKIILEDHNIENYEEQNLTNFINGKDYNSGYDSLFKNVINIENFVLILTLKR